MADKCPVTSAAQPAKPSAEQPVQVFPNNKALAPTLAPTAAPTVAATLAPAAAPTVASFGVAPTAAPTAALLSPEMSAALLPLVMEIMMAEGWACLSPTQRNNQWAVSCRSLELIMRRCRRAYLMEGLQMLIDASDANPRTRLQAADMLDVV